MTKLRGAFTALVTPMFDDGSVDYEGFRRLVQFQLENGISGLVPLGTTGETPTLDESEEIKLIEIVMKEAGGKVPVIIGAGSNSTRDAVRYVQRAKDAGADYALVVTPYYNKPTDEGLYRHFAACAEVGIPVIVYNIAGRTGKNISTALLARIAELPNIAGVKEASGSIDQMMEVIQKIKLNKPDFAVLSGDDSLNLPLAALGGDGVISVVSNIEPKRVTELTLAALKGDFETARALHYELLPFFKAAFIETNPVPIKAAMNLKGLPAGSLRLPLCSLQKENEQKLLDAMKAAKILD
ncbi:4-hydroxy-tetrahydrodipicolinate synthase [Brucepastera parasyntrophica]|uniref:4-hydroxy-tetrahydrodipicolinate synthase n=1 Tax=Brucepastera parasyntrophica TaxID=2880008 RepID=UPI00210C0E59|nr:4-hydroxy-tetrahydrodipicolinate synthase [Brucepastera parasyntrophica]ULQ60531.1 4-hydroxy-tetrahydrodipicolinate synthase [Brucepastera parasyntrophica]